jgi:hypothetical protein
MGLPFMLTGILQSTVSTYVAWLGAGAGETRFFPIKTPFDPRLRDALDRDSVAARNQAMDEYIDQELVNVRKMNFNNMPCGTTSFADVNDAMDESGLLPVQAVTGPLSGELGQMMPPLSEDDRAVIQELQLDQRSHEQAR